MHDLLEIVRVFFWAAPIATAIAIEWSVTKFINFATCDLAIVCLTLGPWSANYRSTLLVGGIAYIGLRLIVYSLLIRRLEKLRSSTNHSVAAAIGLSLSLVAGAGLLFGTTPIPVPLIVNSDTSIYGLRISGESLTTYMVGSAGLFLALVFLFLTKSGKCVSLLRSNRTLALYSGVGFRAVEIKAVMVSAVAGFAGVWAFGTTQNLAVHDGLIPSLVGINIALLAAGHVRRSLFITCLFCVLLYLTARLLQVDLAIAIGLFLIVLCVVVAARKPVWRLSEAKS